MLNIFEADGVRSLHFGTLAVQGAMRVDQPDAIELEYVRQMMLWMLFRDEAAHIVQLGLGAAALTKFCYRYLAPAKVTAVELNPEVIETCREHFALPLDDERLSVLCMDAGEFVGDFSRRRTVDVLQVDLYDAQAEGPVLSSESFYAACANVLQHDGIMTVNLYCDASDHLRHILAIEQSFAAVAWLPEVHDGNIVAIAFKRAPSIDFSDLYQRAKAIHADTGMDALGWVDGLQLWMQGALDLPASPDAGPSAPQAPTLQVQD